LLVVASKGTWTVKTAPTKAFQSSTANLHNIIAVKQLLQLLLSLCFSFNMNIMLIRKKIVFKALFLYLHHLTLLFVYASGRT